MADKFLRVHPTLNEQEEHEATAVSTGVGEAGDIVALDASGKLDISLMPAGIGADVAVIEASEALDAGDYVNIYNNGGTANVRKADASAANAAEIAHGFVKDNFASSAMATVYFEGTNDDLSSLVPGTTYALSHTTPGAVIALASATTTAGHSLQIVGVAVSATAINTEIAKPTIRG